MKADIKHLFVSPAHDFKGRHGQERLDNGVIDCDQIELVAGSGIVGDRYFDFRPDFKGQITFFEESVWREVRSHFDLVELSASEFRRNVIIDGLDLNGLIGQRFELGGIEFTGSEEAAPCYWMNEACAPGVEEFLRGKGGLRCRIVKGGLLTKGSCELRILGEVS